MNNYNPEWVSWDSLIKKWHKYQAEFASNIYDRQGETSQLVDCSQGAAWECDFYSIPKTIPIFSRNSRYKMVETCINDPQREDRKWCMIGITFWKDRLLGSSCLGSGVPQNRGLVHVSRLYTENFTVCWKGFPVLIAKSSIDQPDQPFSFSQTLEITSEW